jgi:hypothetical protein
MTYCEFTPSRPGLQPILVAIVAVTAFPWLFARAAIAEEPQADADVKLLEGRWMRRQPMTGGMLTIVKEHKHNATFLTAFDDQGQVLYAHQSQYRHERSGKVRIFTFYNRKITAGPNAGKELPQAESFNYRLSRRPAPFCRSAGYA